MGCPPLFRRVLTRCVTATCSKPESARLEAITQQYAKAFKSAEALKPVMYVEKNWTAEEFSGGCYVGVRAPPFC